MITRQFDDFFLAKIAFQTGYQQVYRNETKPTINEIASPSDWIIDNVVVNEFAHDNNFERIESIPGDKFTLEEEEMNVFLLSFAKEIERANTMSVDELLEERHRLIMDSGMMTKFVIKLDSWQKDVYYSSHGEAHGKTEVMSYTTKKKAKQFETEQEASEYIDTLPEWTKKEKYIVEKFKPFDAI